MQRNQEGSIGVQICRIKFWEINEGIAPKLTGIKKIVILNLLINASFIKMMDISLQQKLY